MYFSSRGSDEWLSQVIKSVLRKRSLKKIEPYVLVCVQLIGWRLNHGSISLFQTCQTHGSAFLLRQLNMILMVRNS